jgi:hypothetical protein
LQRAGIIGARALLIHALDAAAAGYCRERGFAQLSAEEEALFVTMGELRAGLG